jgi:hypothetical protein
MIKKLAIQAALGAMVAGGALAAMSAPASAYVVCNREGDCWHTEKRYSAPGVTFQWHPDDWYFHQHWDADRDHRWHDYREGRGYYRNGIWMSF